MLNFSCGYKWKLLEAIQRLNQVPKIRISVTPLWLVRRNSAGSEIPRNWMKKPLNPRSQQVLYSATLRSQEGFTNFEKFCSFRAVPHLLSSLSARSMRLPGSVSWCRGVSIA